MARPSASEQGRRGRGGATDVDRPGRAGAAARPTWPSAGVAALPPWASGDGSGERCRCWRASATARPSAGEQGRRGRGDATSRAGVGERGWCGAYWKPVVSSQRPEVEDEPDWWGPHVSKWREREGAAGGEAPPRWLTAWHATSAKMVKN